LLGFDHSEAADHIMRESLAPGEQGLTVNRPATMASSQFVLMATNPVGSPWHGLDLTQGSSNTDRFYAALDDSRSMIQDATPMSKNWSLRQPGSPAMRTELPARHRGEGQWILSDLPQIAHRVQPARSMTVDSPRETSSPVKNPQTSMSEPIDLAGDYLAVWAAELHLDILPPTSDQASPTSNASDVAPGLVDDFSRAEDPAKLETSDASTDGALEGFLSEIPLDASDLALLSVAVAASLHRGGSDALIRPRRERPWPPASGPSD
jgi:hypothetical protein